MPRRLPPAQHPTSPGLAGAVSADTTWSASFPSVEGAALESRGDASVTTQACLNGLDKSDPGGKRPCACWTQELDDFLRQSARTHKDHEKRSIDTIRSLHPGISKKVIWEHCCPKQDRPVAGSAENRRLGGAPATDSGGGLQFE